MQCMHETVYINGASGNSMFSWSVARGPDVHHQEDAVGSQRLRESLRALVAGWAWSWIASKAVIRSNCAPRAQRRDVARLEARIRQSQALRLVASPLETPSSEKS